MENGILATEITELREILKKFQAGEISRGEVTTAVSIYNQLVKRENLTLRVMELGARFGRDKLDNAIENNILVGK